MEVIVDGAANFRVEGEPKDVMSVVRAADELLRKQDRAMVALLADGERISPARLHEEIGDRPVATVKRLEIRSESVHTLIETCLSELDRVLPELPNACHSLAEVFHGEQPQEGFGPFNSLAELWGVVKERERMVMRALDLNANACVLDSVPFSKLHEELNGHLEQAAKALEQNDLILLGDLLEYELAPRAEQEARIAAQLREHAAARPRT